MDQGLGGGKGATEHFGDFFVAQFLLAAKQDGGALILRQRRQRFPDLFLQLAPQQAFRGCAGRFVLELAGRRIFCVGRRCVERLGRDRRRISFRQRFRAMVKSQVENLAELL